MRTLSGALVAILLAGGAIAAEPATVERVVDGDTLDLTSGRALVRIELADVDAPELDQPFGQEASKLVHDLAGGKTVRVQATARNRFGQFYAHVYLPDGRLLNEELLSRGLAWWKSTTSQDVALGNLELQARAQGKGLWAESDPVPPWDWRFKTASSTMKEAEEIGKRIRSKRPSCIPRSECCKVCRKGKACGATCIYAGYTCHVGRGCACDSSEIC